MDTGENTPNQNSSQSTPSTQGTQSTTTTGSSQSTPTTPEQNTLMAVLAYIGPLVIVSYVMAKDDPFVKFHIKQGTVLFIIEVIVMVASNMMYGLFGLFGIINLVLFALSIIGIVNVIQKKEAELPLVGHLSKHVNI